MWSLVILLVVGCVIKDKPSLDAESYLNRGLVYYEKGQYDKAISDCNKAIALNPELAMAYYNRGAARFLKKEYHKAWDDVHKAQHLGLQIPPRFFKTLREASGRQR